MKELFLVDLFATAMVSKSAAYKAVDVFNGVARKK